jgi:hypothetical protein
MVRFALLLMLAVLSHQAWAAPPPPAPAAACAEAIAATERGLGIARGLLPAIGLVESGHGSGPWPWTIDVGGEDHFFATKAEAVASVRLLQAQGVRSIDVGCVQVNLQQHPDAFASLEDAFDPAANVAYGGRFLRALYLELGNWPDAAAAYHSRTPELAAPYLQRVLALWPAGRALGGVIASRPAPPGGGAGMAALGMRRPGTMFVSAVLPGSAGSVVSGETVPRSFAWHCCGRPKPR